jgi:undecaprenyl-diphosphatase
MKKRSKQNFCIALVLLAAFSLWTVAVCTIDVQPIGPMGSAVGFAAMNRAFHALTGVHLSLYFLTDILSLIPLCLAAGFGALGLFQWKQRKGLFLVDRSLFVLGGFYVAVLAIFFFFERCAVNFRPILIDGVLEASYPSSTTMLVLCVMPTAALQLRDRISAPKLRRGITAAICIFTLLMVVGRILSGVHWLSDIIGGILLSAGLVMLYDAVNHLE